MSDLEDEIPVIQSYADGKTHGYSTSTFNTKITQETLSVRSGSNYNPDLNPPQSPILKLTNINIMDPQFRQELLEFSQFLKTQTYKIFNRIVTRGWSYVDKLPVKPTGRVFEEPKDTKPVLDYEWTPELEQAAVEVASKGTVIDTAYLTKFADDKYRIFTHNNEHRLYGKNRQITEVYVWFPAWSDLFLEDMPYNYTNQTVGFLTQNTQDKRRANRHMLNTIPEEFQDKEIFRKCVVVQPRPDISDVHGLPYQINQCQTALEKVQLRFYELLFIHKGGVNKTLVFPNDMSKDNKDNAVTNAKRGMLSRGEIFGVKLSAGRKIEEMVLVKNEPIPDLKFDTVNSHLSEDAGATKQSIEGEAQSGALGGEAPKVNVEEDEKMLADYHKIFAKIIKDINDVFFGIPPDTYEVLFNKDPIVEDPDAMDEGVGSTPRKKDSKTASKGSGSEPAQANAPAREDLQKHRHPDVLENRLHEKAIRHRRNSPVQNAVEENFYFDIVPVESPDTPKVVYHGIETEAIAHGVKRKYMVFRGSMFPAGIYNYPEEGRSETFTPEDIRKLCKRKDNKGILEFDHSNNPVGVGLSGGIGYYKIRGYNKQTKSDITDFYIREEIARKLPNQDKIKLSPYFHRKDGKDGKDIYITNVGVMAKLIPRAELSGLDSSAERVETL